MKHVEVLKRAWHMVTRYRALWIFGIVLALTTASWAPSTLSNQGGNDEENGETITIDPESDFGQQMQEVFGEEAEDLVRQCEEGIPPEVERVLLPVAITLGCIGVILFIVFRVLRYVAEVALIRMVDQYEATGDQPTWRQGFRLGWSRAAWRIFLINWVVYPPAVLAAFVVLLVLELPLAFAAAGSMGAGRISAGIAVLVIVVGLLFLIIFLAVIFFAAIGLLVKFFRRVCALEDKGVFASIREGYAIARQHLKDVGLMWLIMLGVDIGYPVAIIPVVLLLVAAGVLVGGAIGLVTHGIAGLFMQGAAAWVAAGAVGIPLFVLVLVIPLALLAGLREVFTSSSWTLTYRELRALESLEPVELPEADAPGVA
jgi:hypothetical protein